MEKRSKFEWDGGETPPAPQGYNGRGRPPRGGSSFLARFGQVIVRHGIAAIPSALYHFQGRLQLTAQEVWFVSAVLAHKWTEEMPHPNLSRMSAQTGVQERRLRRYKQSLSNIGFLQVYPRYEENGRQDSSYYDFGPLFERLEKMITEEQGGVAQANSISASKSDDEADIEGEGEGASGAAVMSEGVDTSFVARFGSVIVSRGVAAIPQALFTCQGDLSLSPQQVWFVSYILSVPWSPPYPYPSLLKMAARTGYSKMQLHEIKKSLVEQGYLRLVRRTKQDGGQDSNGYDFAGLLEAIRDMLQPHSAPQARVEEWVTEDTGRRRQGRAAAEKRAQNVENRTVNKLTGEMDMRLTRQAVNKLTGVADIRLTGEGVTKITGETDIELTHPVRGASGTGRHAGLPGRRMQSAPYIETSLEEKEKDDSNQIARIGKANDESNGERRPEYSPFIAQVITDFSQELGDGEHIVSNVSQALRLWEKSGLGDEEFVGCLYDAKGLTRKYQARPHNDAMQNKMAYFFTVLRSLVG